MQQVNELAVRHFFGILLDEAGPLTFPERLQADNLAAVLELLEYLFGLCGELLRPLTFLRKDLRPKLANDLIGILQVWARQKRSVILNQAFPLVLLLKQYEVNLSYFIPALT
jgi:hypothetical protein